MLIKTLLTMLVKGQRESHILIGLSANTSVSFSTTFSYKALPFNAIRERTGIFANSTISNNGVSIPENGSYRISGAIATQNGAYGIVSVNGTQVGGAGIQVNASFMSAPVPATIKKLTAGDVVSLNVCKSSNINPTFAGNGMTYLLIEKLGG